MNNRNKKREEEIVVLPNAKVPIVLNPKFEFVKYEADGENYSENHPVSKKIDLYGLTQL